MEWHSADIAGQVEVKGRGGTELQPSVDHLENANDYPKDGPILIITDGEIEDKMKIHRDHAFLIPKGKRLPFVPKGNCSLYPVSYLQKSKKMPPHL